jgi:hypothetical protein
MADMHGPGARTEKAQITARVNDSAACARRDECFSGPIDGKAFGDSAEVDNQRPKEPNRPVALEGNIVRPSDAAADTGWREQMPLAQKGGDRDIEGAVALARKGFCRVQHTPGPLVDPNRMERGFAVEPANITVVVVKTHQAVGFFDSCESPIDGAVRSGLVASLGRDFNERSQERAGPPHFT